MAEKTDTQIWRRKLIHKYGGEGSLRFFIKQSKLISKKFHTVCFYCLSQGLPIYIETEVLTTCCYFIWDKVFKNRVRKICGKNSKKNLKRYGLLQTDHTPFKYFKGGLPQVLLGSFLNTLSHIEFFLKKEGVKLVFQPHF